MATPRNVQPPRHQQHVSMNSLSSSSPQSSPSSTTSPVRTAPLSWKDAVQRTLATAAPAPPPPLPKSPQTIPASVVSPPLPPTPPTDDAPVATPTSAYDTTVPPLRTPTKLAVRSRSVSRIVHNVRKRADLSAPDSSVSSHPKQVSFDATTATTVAASKKKGKKKNSSAAATAVTSKAVPTDRCRSEEDSKRFADLVNRLGLNDAQRMVTSSLLPRRDTSDAGRPRAASADSVLLRRKAPPLYVLTAEPPAVVAAGASSTFRRLTRKDRSLSVPNNTAHTARDASSSASTKHVDDGGSHSELDCEDTHSESTSESSCASPRHSPMTHFAPRVEPLDEELRSMRPSLDDEIDSFSDYMTPEDEEEDYEALLLLDRINSLSAEFKAHRDYEESSALAWSVQHAARQGVISPQLQQNLLATIRQGAWQEARDVLYHKCHLVPAVGSVVESRQQAVALDDATREAFVATVDALAPTDSADERHQKLRALKELSDLITHWVKLVGYERGLSDEHVALTSGSLFLAGSYRLGLHDPMSDIDAVCVVPWHVTHDDFFGSFCQLLEQTPGVTQLAPVPTAYVPLISLSFLDVSIDLLFARLPMTCVEPHQEIDSDHLLVGVDPTSMKSLNAPRVSSMLLCLVPRRRVFRVVLRAVRAWARRRGIYSAKLGYLGGISWAILVAFVCQLYPDGDPAKVFLRFFQVFSEWQWPRPIMLNMVYDAGLGFEMWDPRQNLYDRAHIMPIITPAYPHMNSAVQVSQSTFSVIYEELWRARYLAEMAAGVARSVVSPPTPGAAPAAPTINTEISMPAPPPASASSSPSTAAAAPVISCSWDKLFQRSNFFIRYDSYIVVNFSAASANAMHIWGKFVQSRLRKLVDSLQHVTSVSRVHAFPLYFGHTSDGHTPGSCVFIGVEFAAARPRHHGASESYASPKDDPEVVSNVERTMRFFLATDLQQLTDKQQDMQADATLLGWEELPDFVFEHGRPAAVVERAEYREDMERMSMLQGQGLHFRSPGNYHGASGKWRSPNGGQRGAAHRMQHGGARQGGKPARPRMDAAAPRGNFMAQAG